MKKLKRSQVFRDPIYGYIKIEYEVIKKIIDTTVFQRLRRIRQLSGVQMVFHGAEHSRFSHSLGVYETANRFIEIKDINNYLEERSKLLFLTSALLHDIGHGPYSHAFEETFNFDHEKMGALIILNNKELRNTLDEIDMNFADDVSSIILKKGKFPLIEQLISSQLDVDRLDYLTRDAYHTGVTYGTIDLDRIMRVLRIVDNKIVFKESGIHAIENYLISRYHMYWQVYYHKTSRSYEVILDKIYQRVKDLIENNYSFNSNIKYLKQFINKQNIDSFMKIDDYYINGLIMAFQDEEDSILKELSFDFLNRKIWKTLEVNEENEIKIGDIKNNFSKETLKYFTSIKTVEESTYIDYDQNLADQIYVLLENGKIDTLSNKSKIIKSLLLSGQKEVPLFFYKKI